MSQSESFVDDFCGALNVELKWASIGILSVCGDDEGVSPSLEYEESTSRRIFNKQISRPVWDFLVLSLPELCGQLKSFVHSAFEIPLSHFFHFQKRMIG